MTQDEVLSVQSIEAFLLKDLTSTSEPLPSQFSYHEMDAVPVREVDSLEILQKNIQTLSEIRSKLQFMNREIRYLMKI